jgi:hypothetical protein
MARKHGFEPAEPQWRGRLLEDTEFKRVAAALRDRAMLPKLPNRYEKVVV